METAMLKSARNLSEVFWRFFFQTEQDLHFFAKEKPSLNRSETRGKKDNQIRNDLNLTNIKDVVRANVVFDEINYLLESHVDNQNWMQKTK